jgi:hypothetical protein
VKFDVEPTEVFKQLITNLITQDDMYEACPESKDTKVLNMHNIFNLQKRHCERIACI